MAQNGANGWQFSATIYGWFPDIGGQTSFPAGAGDIDVDISTNTREADVDQWDAIAGVKGRFAFRPEHHRTVPYYFDIGAGDSDLTWQGMLGLAYAFGWGDLGVAWRYLDCDLGSEGPIADMNFNGPALGATFRW